MYKRQLDYNSGIPRVPYSSLEPFEVNFELFSLDKKKSVLTFSGHPATDSYTRLHSRKVGKIKKLVHFPVGLFNYSFDESNKNEEVNDPEEEYITQPKQDFFLNRQTLDRLWKLTTLIIQKYQNAEASFRLKLTHQLEAGEQLDFIEELKKWKTNNRNPLEVIGKECLDPILKKFFLSVKTKIDDFENRKFIQIQSDTTGEVIPYEKLSSGTRQIIYTAFPIYSLLEDNSILLIDEPENSLYPDIQKEIIEYYTSFDKDKKSQFFFATHSPIIASAFEPWEIVELKFDKKGNIYRELYYDGENHVDNYHIDARYLRWDGILTKVFDLKEDGNAPFRSKKLMEFSILKKEIESLRKADDFDPDSTKMKNLLQKLQRVGELLDWET